MIGGGVGDEAQYSSFVLTPVTKDKDMGYFSIEILKEANTKEVAPSYLILKGKDRIGASQKEFSEGN